MGKKRQTPGDASTITGLPEEENDSAVEIPWKGTRTTPWSRIVRTGPRKQKQIYDQDAVHRHWSEALPADRRTDSGASELTATDGPGSRRSPSAPPWLALALQTTLEISELLAIFEREAQETVAFDALAFRGNDAISFDIGARRRHRCVYCLKLLDEDLGEVEFSRHRAFSQQELANIELLLSALVYPLRNALHYRAALCAAHRDPLTGLGNRRSFEEALPREVRLSRRNGHSLALLAVDLDHFKHINDSYGHQIGDFVLRMASERIMQVIRTSDLAFRYGGEELVVLLSNTDRVGAETAAERICRFIADTPAQCGNTLIDVTASIGVAIMEDEDDGDTLFGKADFALYEAKSRGRNCTVTFSAVSPPPIRIGTKQTKDESARKSGRAHEPADQGRTAYGRRLARE